MERTGPRRAWLGWAAAGLLLTAGVAALWLVPVAPVVDRLLAWTDELGAWGPFLFVLVYIVAVLALVPASALTMAAGALFGPVLGAAVALPAAMAATAVAFLAARYLARNRVARATARYPRLAALDRALSVGGWKVVALLRLSPAVPFTLQNYFYGLTGISLWTCLLTSAVAMVPGCLLYVYLGYAGRASLEAVSGNARSRTPAEWALLAGGLVATVVVTVYVTRLARQALRQQVHASAPGPTAAPSGTNAPP